MSNSLNQAPQLVGDLPTPYDIPYLMWDKLETYFSKYGVSFRETKPQDRVSGPVIVWEIYSRVPGKANSNVQTRGATYSHPKTLRDGKVVLCMMQVHSVTYRFKIYSDSSEITNKIAWDLERLLPQTAGIVGRQDDVPGLQLVFLKQTSQEEDRVSVVQDDLVMRNLLFLAQVPVFYEEEHTVLSAMRLRTYVGRVLTSTGRVTRTSSSSRYDIEVSEGQKVVGIFAIFKLADSTTERDSTLKINVDYYVRKDESGALYIDWEDTYGNVPAVGEDFRVEYFNSAVLTSYPDLTREPSI